MSLPTPRGPISGAVLDALSGRAALDVPDVVARVDASQGDVILDDDLQLALWVMYELHYGGLDGVADTWEWSPDLLRVRAAVEARFEACLRERTAADVATALAAPGDVATRIFAQAEASDGPPLTRFLQREATAEQFREVLVHRSIYQLKEGDPHTFVVPRVHGSAKVALVELQFDEYGAGRPDRQHATLYAEGMEECGLDRAVGAYVDAVPACTLALNNAGSLLCLHRRLRGAAVGHLAAIEVTSSLPCRKLVQGLRRLDLSPAMTEYFDEHVEADAVHEQVATRDICAALVEQEPGLAEDVSFGVAVSLLMDELLAEHVLGCFRQGRSSLRAKTLAGAVA
jgi:Iron-containing redox enzyme